MPLLVEAQSYSFQHFSAPYTDLQGATSINQGETWDEIEAELPIGFPFTMYNEIGTELSLYGSGGGLQLDNPLICYDLNGAAIGSMSSTSGFLCLNPDEPFVDRNYPTASASPLSFLLEGAVGNRILKIEFKNVGFIAEYGELGSTPSFMNLQFWFYEADCAIEFRFGDLFIQDPSLIYGTESGGLYGLRHWVCLGVPDQGHWLTGDAAAPTLLADPAETYIQGTPAPGTVYRFERTGGCELSTGVQALMTDHGSAAFPNPSHGLVRISVGSAATDRVAYLYSVTGALISTVRLATSQSFDLRLPDDPGIYLIRLTSVDGTEEQLRVIRD